MRDNKSGYVYYDYSVKTEKAEVAEVAWKSVFRWMYAIVGILFVVFTVLIFFVRIVEVDGNSMNATLHDGDRLFVYTFDYTPEQGDIVFIGSSNESETLIKRVIATGGQTVNIDYNAHTLTVDGKTVEENYLYETMSERAEREITYPYTVPDGCVFYMGDNRNDSKDSRDCRVGCVSEKYIIGKALFRIMPFSDRNIYK